MQSVGFWGFCVRRQGIFGGYRAFEVVGPGRVAGLGPMMIKEWPAP